jgi:hypothetical protein
MDRVSPCNIYVNQPDTQCFMIEFIHNIWWLDMFRTSVVHPQERLQAVCCRYVWTYQVVRKIPHTKSFLQLQLTKFYTYLYRQR